MRKVIHHAKLGHTLKDAAHIQLFFVAAAASHAKERNRFELFCLFLHVRAALWLEETEHDVRAAGFQFGGILQHAIGFADASGITEVDFQMAPACCFVTHGGRSQSLVQENANVDPPHRSDETAYKATEHACSQIPLHTVPDEDLSDGTRAGVLDNRFNRVIAH